MHGWPAKASTKYIGYKKTLSTLNTGDQYVSSLCSLCVERGHMAQLGRRKKSREKTRGAHGKPTLVSKQRKLSK